VKKKMIKIEHWDSEVEMILDMHERGFLPQRYTYPPGTYFPPHTHDQEKIAAVFSGELRIVMVDETIILKAGDGILVPKGVVHSADVVGEQSVVSVDAPKSNFI
jgi:quercetin dioxygenase-like cupin family protein